MKLEIEARADWRVLTNAACVGAAVGLSLGAAYLGAGLGQVALSRGEAVRVALSSQPAFGAASAPGSLRGLQALDPDTLRMANAPPTRARELDCLTQAVYFEARGESARGQQAVATVIMNRVKNPNFPKTVCGVVYQGSARRNGCQFSFACDGAAERVVEQTAWRRAHAVAARVLSGALLRDVGSATHFHTTGVSPDWGSRMLRVAQVGLHVFYRFNPNAPRAPVLAGGKDDDAVFTSSTSPAPTEIRLAEALTAPAVEPMQSAAPKAPAAAPDAKLPKLPDISPISAPKAEAAPAAKAEAPTAS